MLPKCSLFLTFSLTINFSVGAYFFFAPVAKYVLSKSRSQMALRFLKLYQERPGLVRKLFRDQLINLSLFISGVVLLITSDVLQNPLRNTSQPLLTVFAVNLGNYIYKCLQDSLLRKEIPFFKINLLHHVVAVSTYTVFITYEQNAISGVIGLLFEGSVILFDFKCVLPFLGVKKNSLLYIGTVFVGFVTTITLRAICPFVLLVLAVLKHSPLAMDYLPLGFFFMNIVFFTMINGWLVKNGFYSLRRRWLSRRLFLYLEREGQNSQAEGSSLEMNNLFSSRQYPRSVLPIIIPSDESFRLAAPVSNVNMTCENAEISNISLSRHERTVPKINSIINDTSTAATSSSGDGVTEAFI